MTTRTWVSKTVGAPLFEQLARELSGSELASMLLDVMRQRARRRSPSELLAQFARDPFCTPAVVDQRTSVAIDALLLEAARGFEAVELSPVAPLGCTSAIGLTDQNRVLSALRSTEVVSDPTNVLALESAARLRKAPSAPVHFTTSQRVIRAQPVPKMPGYAQHFRIFVLTSGGPETRDYAFTVESLVSHVRTMNEAFDRLETCGYSFGERHVDILATPARASVGDRIAAAVGPIAVRKELEHPYYSGGLRYMFWTTTPDGKRIPLADGGAFDWLQKLTSNRRAVFIASGAGAQLVPIAFRK